MSHVSRMLDKIEDLIKISRGISLDVDDTRMLDDAMKRLTGHFHCLHRKAPIWWPDDYLELEAEFCKWELDRLANSSESGMYFNCHDVKRKREKFNELWNDTHKVKFIITDRGGD